MPRLPSYSLLLFLGILELTCAPRGTAQKACATVTVMREGSPSLSGEQDARLRSAVRHKVQSIINDKAMGLEDLRADQIPLTSVVVGHPEGNVTLYALSWPDRSFGVNSPIWIVELGPKGAQDLTPSRDVPPSGFSLSGFGVGVLSSKKQPYPDLVIASKGFKDGGGAEAEAVCLAKQGRTYRVVSCSPGCKDALNER